MKAVTPPWKNAHLNIYTQSCFQFWGVWAPGLYATAPICTPPVRYPHSSHQDTLKTNFQNMTCGLRLFHWLPITRRIKSKPYCGLEGSVLSAASPASTTSSSRSACFLNSGQHSFSVPWTCQAHSCILNLLFPLLGTLTPALPAASCIKYNVKEAFPDHSLL